MILRQLTLRNFGSFAGEHGPLQLSGRGLVSIVGRNHDDPKASSNGSGKSTVLDAIDWCLFGKHPRGGKAKAVVNEATGKDCQVQLQLTADEGPDIIITRSVKVKGVKDGVKLQLDGDDVSKLDPSATQAAIEAAIGFDRELFHSAVLFAQNDNLKFAEKTDAQRKELLTKMLPDLAVVDTWLETAKTLRSDYDAAVRDANAQLATLDTRIAALTGADPRLLATQWQEQHEHQLQSAQRDQLQAQMQADNAAHALASHRSLPQPQPPESTEYDAQFVHWTQELERLANERAALAAAQALAERQLYTLTQERTCHACNRPFDAEHSPEQVQQAEEALQAADAALAAAEAAQSDAQANRDAAAFQQHQVMASYTEAQNAYRQAAADAERLAAASKHAQLTAQNAAHRLQQIQQQRNPYTQQVEQWQLDYANANEERQSTLQALLEAQTQHTRAEWWVKALGPKGIKSHLLDLRVQELTEEVNRWVQLLTQGTCQVRMSAFTETGTGAKARNVDKFTISVFKAQPDGTWLERDYCQWSGGEKHRLAVGIDFGFSRMVEKRAEGSCPQLFLDEVFQKSLDVEGRQAMAELLTHLAREKDSIWVVDHDARFQGAFADVVTVEKQGGASRITTGMANG